MLVRCTYSKFDNKKSPKVVTPLNVIFICKINHDTNGFLEDTTFFTNAKHKVHLFVTSSDLRIKYVTNKLEFSPDTIGTYSSYVIINIFPLNTENRKRRLAEI